MEFNLKKILKALLFSSSEALSIKEIQGVFARYHKECAEERAQDSAEGELPQGAFAQAAAPAPQAQEVMEELIAQVPALLTATQIRDAMDELAHEFEESGDIMRLIQGPNGFRLATAAPYAQWVRLLRCAPKPIRLSQAALETLAMIAYRQPVTRAEMEAIRGVSSDSAINTLLEYELIQITGRADLPGRPIQYGTTDKFLDFCGVRSLEELPASDVITPAQLNEWIRRATQGESQGELLDEKAVGLPEEEPPAPLADGGFEGGPSQMGEAPSAENISGEAQGDSPEQPAPEGDGGDLPEEKMKEE